MRRMWVSLLAILAITGSVLGVASEDKKLTVKQVMQKAHGRNSNILKKVMDGSATKEDKALLVELYSSMPDGKPKHGDEAAFKKLGEAMVVAAKAAQSGESGWKEKLQKATNCKSCHDAYK